MIHIITTQMETSIDYHCNASYTTKYTVIFTYKVCVWHHTCTLSNYSHILACIITLLLLNRCVPIKNVNLKFYYYFVLFFATQFATL